MGNKKGRSVLYFGILTIILLATLGIVYALTVQEEDSETQTETSSIVYQINGLSESSSCNFNDPECTINGNCFCNVNENELLQFNIIAEHYDQNGNPLPVCTWAGILPPVASYPTVSGFGSVISTFAWTPMIGQAGDYLVEFHAGEQCFVSERFLPVRIHVDPAPPQEVSMCGDLDDSGTVNSADIIRLVNYVFKGGPAPDPLWTADTNMDGKITSADIIKLVNYVFKGGEAPCTVTCCYEEGCTREPFNTCDANDGVVQECVPGETTSEGPPGIPVNYTPANITSPGLTSWVDNLTRAINDSNVHNGTYVPGVYDCDDFADNLERNLTARGYNATYTVYWCTPAVGPRYGHCVTDVHAPDGSIVFIEPQTGRFANLDFDGDGVVETRNHHPAGIENTDDNCAIEVYDDAAAAAAAGAPRD